MNVKTILIVEDEGIVAKELEIRLKNFGYHVIGNVSSGEEAVEEVIKNRPDLVLMDIMLEGQMDGITAAKQIAKVNVPVVYLTAYSDRTTIERVWDTGFYGYVTKPFNEQQLRVSIDMAIHRHELEKNLKKSETFFKEVIENIPNMIFIKDAKELRFVRFNKAGEELLGYSREDLIGKNDYDFFSKEEADFFTSKDREALSKRKLFDIPEESIQTRTKGKRLLHTKKIPILNEKGQPNYLLGISEDITERKHLEEQLRQIQKMESVGNLAGGVAHDFNNMLSIILGNTEMVMEDLDGANPVIANLMEIKKAAERSADLTRQLLAFARKQTISPKVLNINETIEGILKMLGRLIGENIDLTWLPQAGLWPVKVDPSQVDQVLANLCVNARDSIADAGKVTIETDNKIFNEEYCRSHVDFKPGEYVMIAVSDNGLGMDKKTRENIFEPFFTTKDVGEGTGLGLSTVYGIVKQNNGFVNVYSELNEGTTFKIYLPRYVEKTAQPQRPLLEETAVTGNETILLVEDEKAILRTTTMMLERLGYTVIGTFKPTEAISIAESHAGEIDMLMTDVVMPEMSGRELAATLSGIYPKLRCLFMSGYTANVIARHGVLDEGVHFIHKPFAKQDLAKKVREVLDVKSSDQK